MMKIISWNVNGIRAIHKKGFLEWLMRENPDILCVQETKANPDQLVPELLNPPGYFAYFNAAEKKGYSGVATFTREKPEAVRLGIGIPRFDVEGRVVMTEYPSFALLNIYFPNGARSEERLQYKLDFYQAVLEFVEKLKKKHPYIIISGDYNTAHKPIDLARPVENETVSGFLPIERTWLDTWIQAGQVDIFRHFCPLPEQYTWWDMKSRARERNVGWRIDYHFVTDAAAGLVSDAQIHPGVMGSDHCPISLEIQF